ncbi:hypothetical protein M0638_20245 [Roseomonas sp. NAR14]|uniref:Uncharacterized protein n=1 Tax=Roseomonas acroporae TaxID=2937791 RepID=A0A9X1YDH6_9PROT|nr:hypothetical protein [Roseomonas acroporae]MCK8786707.1 hypothetical protein [Roseomonas acroporae]
MADNDLARRVDNERGEAKGLSRLLLLWRRTPELPAATGEECARSARDPQRRLEPLRRCARESFPLRRARDV